MVRSRRRRLRAAALVVALVAVLTTLTPSVLAQAAPSPWSSYGTWLGVGASMPCQNYLESPNELYALFLGCDAELRLYAPDGSSQLIYPSLGSVAPTSLTLRADGSLVMRWNGYPVWSTGAPPVPVQAAMITDDGRFGPLTRDWDTVTVASGGAPAQLALPVGNLAAHLRTLQDDQGQCWRARTPADASAGSTLTPCTGRAASWRFTGQPDGTWTATNVDSGLCLTALTPTVRSDVGASVCTGSTTQRWRVLRWIRPATGASAYALVPASGVLPLTAGFDTSPSARLFLSTRDPWFELCLFTL